MRIALLGAGRIGRLHAELLAGLTDAEGLFIADIDGERAKAVASEVGATAVPDSLEAIERADASVIAAPTDAHATLIRRSLARGIPTFCEKPLAASLEETIDLVRLIDASDVPVQVGFQRRFDPAYQEARRLVTNGGLGIIYLIRLAGHDPAPPHEAYIPTSGGIFRDFSIHDFDALRYLTASEVTQVYADGSVRGFPVFAKYRDVDTAVATLRLADGTLAVLTAARHDPLGYDVRTELFGSRDSVAIGLGQRTPLRSLEPDVPSPVGPLWSDFLIRFRDAYRAELAEFLRVARGGAPSPCTASDGLAALRVAEAADRSLHEHRVVMLDEIPF
jgi:myo-inositol 2-dehydrogenase / D-chiro-inositol 1-dehydrogenase